MFALLRDLLAPVQTGETEFNVLTKPLNDFYCLRKTSFLLKLVSVQTMCRMASALQGESVKGCGFHGSVWDHMENQPTLQLAGGTASRELCISSGVQP